MRNKFIVVVFLIWLCFAIFFGCSKDEYSLFITQPKEGDTIQGLLRIKVNPDPMPDYVEFLFDTFSPIIDSIEPYDTTFCILRYYHSENYTANAIAHWGETSLSREVSFFIEYLSTPSINFYYPQDGDTVNGDTIRGRLKIKARVSSQPDYVTFYFDSLRPIVKEYDGSDYYYIKFDVYDYPSGLYPLRIIANWGEYTFEKEITVYLKVSDSIWFEITDPKDSDTVCGTFTIKFDVSFYPESIIVPMNSHYSRDYSYPFEININVSQYETGFHTFEAIATWRNKEISQNITVFVLHIDQGLVILNGGTDTIPRDRISRNGGVVTGLDLEEMLLWGHNYLSGIEPLKNTLKFLDLHKNYFPSLDLSPLSAFRVLYSLNLSEDQLLLLDLSPISTCSRIKYLYLQDNKLDSIRLSPLSYWPFLERFYIDKNNLTQLDLSAFSSSSSLWVLDLQENKLTELDLSPLSHCTALKYLYLKNNNLTEIDFTPLSSCPNLKYYLCSNNKLTLVKLPFITYLRGLGLGNNNLTSLDLTPLSACTSFYGLTVSDNNLTSIDLSPLSSSDKLRYIYLQENALSTIDLSPLSLSSKFEHLDLSNNSLTEIDLTPLTISEELTTINLNNNKLKSVELLINNTIRILDLSYNELDSIDISPLSNCPNLPTINLKNNNLKTIDFLPIWGVTTIQNIYLENNDLDSAACAHVCDYIKWHPFCKVTHDCDCE